MTDHPVMQVLQSKSQISYHVPGHGLAILDVVSNSIKEVSARHVLHDKILLSLKVEDLLQLNDVVVGNSRQYRNLALYHVFLALTFSLINNFHSKFFPRLTIV